MSDTIVVFRGQGYSIIRPPKTSNLYVLASSQGKQRLYESLGTAQLMEAKKEARKRYLKYVQDDFKKNDQKLLDDHWSEFDRMRAGLIATGDLDEVTLKRGRNAWERLKDYWGGKIPSEISQKEFNFYSAWLESKYPGCSLQNEHKYLRALINYLHSEGHLPNKPIIKLGKEKKKRINDRRKLEDWELVALVNAADTFNFEHKLLVYNGVYHGMRIGEVGNIKVANITTRNGKWYLYIDETKTDMDREILINSAVLPLLLEAKSRAYGKYAFGMKKNLDRKQSEKVHFQRWDEVRKKADVDCVFHELRHTAISNAVKQFPPGVVSRYFGVGLDVIDKVYLKLTAEDTEACAAAVVLANKKSVGKLLESEGESNDYGNLR